MKHGDKITLNWLGSDVECEVDENYKGWPLIEVLVSPDMCFSIRKPAGGWEASMSYKLHRERCGPHPTPQAALNELASRLGYKQPVPQKKTLPGPPH